MKRIISTVSLVLVFSFILSLCVFAKDEQPNVYTPPEGMDVIYAHDLTGASAPVIDGNIGADEYGKVAKIVTEPFKLAEKWPENIYIIDDDSDRPSSGTIEYYFAYDENSVYIAFKEYGQIFDDGNTEYADYAMRCNYGIEFGFDLVDISNYFLHCITYGSSCWNKDLRLSEGKSSNFSKLDEKPDALYSEFFVNKYAAKDAALPADERKLFTYGDLLLAKNTNSTEPYIIEVEMRIDKNQAIELYNDIAYTNYANFPNAMYFSMGTRVYRAAIEEGKSSIGGYSRYLATDMRGKSIENIDYGILPGAPQQFLPTLIVLGDENTVITVPGEKVETEAPETEAVVTTEIVTETVEESDMGHFTEPAEEEGCGSIVSISAMALVVALGTVTSFVSKKKED